MGMIFINFFGWGLGRGDWMQAAAALSLAGRRGEFISFQMIRFMWLPAATLCFMPPNIPNHVIAIAETPDLRLFSSKSKRRSEIRSTERQTVQTAS